MLDTRYRTEQWMEKYIRSTEDEQTKERVEDFIENIKDGDSTEQGESSETDVAQLGWDFGKISVD